MSPAIESLNSWSDAWRQYVVFAGWQGALVGVVLLAIVLVGRRLPSPLRHALLLIALLKFLTPPFAALPSGVMSQIAITQEAQFAAADDPQVARTDAGEGILLAHGEGTIEVGPMAVVPNRSIETDTDRGLMPLPPPKAGPTPGVELVEQSHRVPKPAISAAPEISISGTDRLVWPAYLMLLHLAGSLLFLGAVVCQAARLRRLVKQSNEVRQGELYDRLSQLAGQFGVRRLPRLFTNSSVGSPFSCGIVRPAIVIPTALVEKLRRDEFDLVLAHELAHHRRCDLAVNWLQAIVHALWWFHPVVWLVNRQLRAVREDCCDDLLLGSRLTDENVYCDTLLRVAASSQGARLPGLALPMSCRQHGLSRRFRRLMDTSIPRAGRLSRFGLLVSLILAAVLLPGLSTGKQPADASADAGGIQPDDRPPARTSKQSSAANKISANEIRKNQTRDLVISVTVDGKPVEGTSVFLSADEAFSHYADGVRVYAQASSDAAGRATLRSPADIWSEQSFYNRTLWIYLSGKALAIRQLSGDEKDVSVALEDLEPGKVRVTGPGEKPLANVIARLLFLRDHTGNFHQVPKSVTDLLQAKSDASGLVALQGIRREQIGQIQLEHANFGRQAIFYERQTRRPESIALRAAGKIVGLAAADDGTPIKGARLRLVTRPVLEQRDSQNTAGAADVTTDEEGRFVVPALMEGELRFIFLEPFDLPYRAAAPENLLVVAGETTELNLPYKTAIVARAQARLQGSGEPVVAARIIAHQGRDDRYLRTDEAGKTAMYLLPTGELRLQVHAPDGYLYVNGPHEVLVPRDKKEFDLPPFEFRRAGRLVGKVVDENGQPVQQARLIGTWKDPQVPKDASLSSSVVQFETAFSDAAGDFKFRRLHPDLPVTIETYVHSVKVGDNFTAKPDSQEPLNLRIARPATVQLQSRVIDKQGAPVQNIHWEIWTEIRGTPNMIAYCIMDEGRTDEHGYVRSNKQFAREGLHGLRIVAAPDVILESERMTPAKSGGNTFPNVILDRERLKDAGRETQQDARPSVAAGVTQRGQVVNRQGHPVAKAAVIAWCNGKRIRLSANAEGHFQIPQAPTTGIFLFVEAPGYRFFGRSVVPGDETIKVTLTPVSQPTVTRRTLDEPDVTDELLQKAWEAYEPFNRQYLKTSGDNPNNLLEAMRWVARFDPPAGLKVAETAKELESWYGDFTRMTAFDALLKRDVESALKIIDGFSEEHYKVNSYVEAAKPLPDTARQRKLELLDEALASARKIQGDWLLIHLAKVASAYHDLGEGGKGKQVFDEALKRADGLPANERSGYERAFLAVQLVKFDQQAAMKLLAGIKFNDDYSHDRHHANMAHALADADPMAAERFLGKVKTERVRDEWTSRICYTMASVDFKRALRLAEAVADPNLRAYSLGVMAVPVAKTDRQAARELLDRAYTIVTELVDTGTSPGRSIFDPLDVGVGLLPFVEMVDPTLVREYFWRALSLRDETTIGSETRLLGFYGKHDRLRLADPVLATALARYDREVARLVMHPPADQAIASGEDYPSYYFYAYTMINPEAAVDLAARLPKDSPDRRKAKWQAWQEVLSSILNRGDERWPQFYDRQLNVWYVGRTDI